MYLVKPICQEHLETALKECQCTESSEHAGGRLENGSRWPRIRVVWTARPIMNLAGPRIDGGPAER